MRDKDDMKKTESSAYVRAINEMTGLFETITGSVSLPKELIDDNRQYFGVKADGDGMSTYGINNGDILMFEVTDQISSGEIGCFVFGSARKSVCRLFKEYENGRAYLFGDLKTREPILVDRDDPDFHVIGKLATVIKDVRNKKY